MHRQPDMIVMPSECHEAGFDRFFLCQCNKMALDVSAKAPLFIMRTDRAV